MKTSRDDHYTTVYAIYFAGVLFSRISRVNLRENFHSYNVPIYSNGNITKIAKFSARELPDLVQNREKLCAYGRGSNTRLGKKQQ